MVAETRAMKGFSFAVMVSFVVAGFCTVQIETQQSSLVALSRSEYFVMEEELSVCVIVLQPGDISNETATITLHYNGILTCCK